MILMIMINYVKSSKTDGQNISFLFNGCTHVVTKADAYNLGNTYCEFSMPKSEITNTAFTSRNVRREKSTYLLILAFECTLDYWFPQHAGRSCKIDFCCHL